MCGVIVDCVFCVNLDIDVGMYVKILIGKVENKFGVVIGDVFVIYV